MEWELNSRIRTTHGEIAYRALGAGPPVVLVHGTPSRSLVWREIAPVLAQHRRVVAFDLLGFGDSERHVEQDVSLVAHGEVLAELIEQLELDRPALVGHDIGGAVVLRAHLIEEVPIAELALIDAVVLAPWITPRTREMQGELERWASDPALEDTVVAHLRSATSRPLAPDVFEALFEQWAGEQGGALYLRHLAQFDERHTDEFDPRLSSIEAPTLVLWGEEDAWLPVETSERVAARIPGAERVVIPGAGHFCMEDEPERVAAELDAFLR